MRVANTTQRTVTVQIGNSDDKLTQVKWSWFILETLNAVADFGAMHFSGGSEHRAQWQNFCLVAVGEAFKLPKLKEELQMICRKYGQDSIALTVGETEFIK